ncbi:Chaperone protein EcpD precursor [compost metagenome]
MFYRPVGLQGSVQDGLNALQWSVRHNDGKAQLTVHNPSPYHYTFRNLQVGQSTARKSIQAREMVAPKSTQAYDLPTSALAPGMQVFFTTINDYGGTTREVTAPVSGL